jgi:hypothetical protein
VQGSIIREGFSFVFQGSGSIGVLGQESPNSLKECSGLSQLVEAARRWVHDLNHRLDSL